MTDFTEATDTERIAAGAYLYNEGNMYRHIERFAEGHRLTQTSAALPFAREKHAGQMRSGPGAVPYIVHPLNMACHAMALGMTDDDILSCALLHDVCEDCGVRPEELPAGEKVRSAVRRLTFRRQPLETRAEAKERYFREMEDDRIAMVTKLLDRCNNVSFMAFGFSKEKLRDYIQETRRFVLPLLEKAREEYPQYDNALYLIKYQLCSVMNSEEAILRRAGKWESLA